MYIKSITDITEQKTIEGKNILQSHFWLAFKHCFDWCPLALRITNNTNEHSQIDECYPLYVLSKKINFGFSFAYVPWGPDSFVPDELKQDYITELAQKLRAVLPGKPLFIRFDLIWDAFPDIANQDIKKSRVAVQVPNTVIVDLRSDEEKILARMKSKTRYNIRLSIKKGVEIRSSGLDALSSWYKMYKTTAERDRIAIHSFQYYRCLFDIAKNFNTIDLELLLAYHNQDLLAGIIVAYTGEQALYLYGASSNLKRNLMPAYGLQWAAIVKAKQRGCSFYDLFGIPPKAEKKDPMYGLYRFKTGFGGKHIARGGCWDYIYHPFKAYCFREIEYCRYLYYKKFLKRQ